MKSGAILSPGTQTCRRGTAQTAALHGAGLPTPCLQLAAMTAPAPGPAPEHPAAPLAQPALWALLPCAGSGARAGGALPKQYQHVAGARLVDHTLRALAQVQRLRGGLVVTAADDPHWRDAALPSARFWRQACGGETRAASVFNGLHALLAAGAAAHDWVLVHDVARCLVRPADIDRLIDAALDDEVGALLACPLADTLKVAQGERAVQTLPRADKWLAQTPQMFRIGLLCQALEAAGAAVTDEASAVEHLGLAPRLVAGPASNFKVTYPEDFALADALLRR